MLTHAKFYRLLCVIILFIFIFEMAALATETNSKKVSDDEILKMIGAEPTQTQSIPNESFSSSAAEFENSAIEIRIHTVKAGDSLSAISKFYYDDSKKAALIAKYNQITNIDQLKVGQKIKIPFKARSLKETALAGSKEIDTSPIEENDLKGKKSILKDGYLLIAIFLLCFLMIIFFLLIKLSGKQVTTKTKEPIKKASFVLGEVEESNNSGEYGGSK